MLFRPFRNLFFLAALLAPSALPAQSAEPADSAPEQARAQTESFFEDLIVELELSDEQAAEVRAIFAANEPERAALLDEMQAIRESGGSRRQRFGRMRDLRSEMQRQQQATRSELAEVLDDEQLDHFDAIMQARREEMRDRIREGRSR